MKKTGLVKKVVSGLLAALMVFATIPVTNVQTVLAATNGILNASALPITPLEPGDSFHVILSINGNTGIDTMSIRATIPDGLELTHATVGFHLIDDLGMNMGLFMAMQPAMWPVGHTNVGFGGLGTGEINPPTTGNTSGHVFINWFDTNISQENINLLIYTFRVREDANVGTTENISFGFYDSIGVSLPSWNFADLNITLPGGGTGNIGPVTVQRNLIGITNPDPLSRPFGIAFTELGLSTTVVMDLGNGVTADAAVVWDSTEFIPNQSGTQTLSGTVVLPDNVLNPDNAISLTTQIQVTIADFTQTDIGVLGAVAQTRAYDGTEIVELTGSLDPAEVGGHDVRLETNARGTIDNRNVGTRNVTTHFALCPTGTDNALFNLVQPTGLIVEITPANLTFDYTGQTTGSATALSSAILTASTNPQASGVAEETLAGVLTWYTDSSRTVLAGANPFNITGAMNLYWRFVPTVGGTGNPDNYVAETVGYVAFNVQTITRGMSFASVPSGTVSARYGDTIVHQATFTQGSGIIIHSSNNLNVASVNPVTGAITTHGPGIATITATAEAIPGLFAEIEISYTLTVSPRLITVAPQANLAPTKVFDSNANIGGIEPNDLIIGGLLPADQSVVTASASNATFRNVNVGSHLIDFDVTIQDDPLGRYSFTLVTYPTPAVATTTINVQGNITPRPLTITGVTAANRPYDGTTIVDLHGGTLQNVVGADNVTLVATGAQGSIASPNVANGVPVTSTGFTLGGTAASNYYLVSQPTGITINITPANFDFTFSPSLVTEGRGATLAGIIDSVRTGQTANGVGTEVLNGVVTWYSNAARTDVITAGTNPFGADGAITLFWRFTPTATGTGNPANYISSVVGSAIFNVGPDLQDVRFADGVHEQIIHAIYGDAPITRAATLHVGGGIITYASDNPSIAEVNPTTGQVTFLRPGQVRITAMASSVAGEWSVAEAWYDLVVSPRLIAVSVPSTLSRTKEFDGTNSVNPPIAVGDLTVSGILAVDATAGVAIAIQNQAYVDVNVGSPGINAVIGIVGDTYGRYTLEAVTYPATRVHTQTLNVTGHITPRPVAITGVTATNRLFDGTPTVVLQGGMLNGAIGDVVLNTAGATGTAATANAGDGIAVTVSGFMITGANAANHSLVQPTNVTVNITPAEFAFTYTGPTMGISSTLFTAIEAARTGQTAQGIPGQTLTGNVTWYTDAAGNTPVPQGENPFITDGSISLWWRFTPVSINTGSIANYVSSMMGEVTFEVTEGNPRYLFFPVGVNSQTITRIYGDAQFTYTATFNVGAGQSNIIYSSSNENVAIVNPSTGQVTIVGTGATVISANSPAVLGEWLEAGEATYTLVVNPMTIQVFAHGVSRTKIFDGNTDITMPILSSELTIQPVNVGIRIVSQVFNSPNVGAEGITLTIALEDAYADGRFVLSTTELATPGTITPLPVTITPDALQYKLFGQDDPVFTFTTSPSNDVVDANLTGNLARSMGANAGTYALMIGSLSGGTNLSLTVLPEVFTITQAQAISTADPIAGTTITMTAYDVRSATNVDGLISLLIASGQLPTTIYALTNGSSTVSLPVTWTTIHLFDPLGSTYALVGASGNLVAGSVTNVLGAGLTIGVTLNVTPISITTPPTFADALIDIGSNTAATAGYLGASILPVSGSVPIPGVTSQAANFTVDWGTQTIDTTQAGYVVFNGTISWVSPPVWLTLPVTTQVSRRVTVVVDDVVEIRGATPNSNLVYSRETKPVNLSGVYFVGENVANIDSASLLISYSGVARDGTPFGPSATAPINAGDYVATITLNQAGFMAEAITINFTISPLQLTWDGSSLTSIREYAAGNTTAPLSGAIGLSGIISPDVVTLTYSNRNATFDNPNVGTGKTVTVTVIDPNINNMNYFLPTTNTFTINTGVITPVVVSPPVTTRTITILNGGVGASGTGSRNVGTTVTISAGVRTGYSFSGWTFSQSVTFAVDDNASQPTTRFVMPNINVTATANWTAISTQPDDGNNDSDGEWTPSFPSLSTPSNPRINDAIFSWNAVNNATSYRIYVGGKAVTGTITGTSFDLASLGLPAGTHTIRVRAIFDGANFNNSVLSSTVNFIVQDTPPPMPTPDPVPPSTPISVLEPAPVWVNPFTDVSANDWFFDSVRFAHQNNLFSGTSDNTFSPNATMTRGMMVTVLHRMAGTPSEGNTIFTDVPNNKWFANGVNWAAANGIVSGFGDGIFGPNDNITREQMAVILSNYARVMDLELPSIRTGSFNDNDQISGWALQSVNTMFEVGIISGRGEGNFDPQGNATRAEVATVLRNFMEAISVES